MYFPKTLNKFHFFAMGFQALVVALILLEGFSNGNTHTSSQSLEKPNIIVILTDQERYPTHWPEGWVEKNLPSHQRLKKHGLTFQRAYTAASECTPSRAVITSSEHYPINKVPSTPLTHRTPFSQRTHRYRFPTKKQHRI